MIKFHQIKDLLAKAVCIQLESKGWNRFRPSPNSPPNVWISWQPLQAWPWSQITCCLGWGENVWLSRFLHVRKSLIYVLISEVESKSAIYKIEIAAWIELNQLHIYSKKDLKPVGFFFCKNINIIWLLGIRSNFFSVLMEGYFPNLQLLIVESATLRIRHASRH